MSFEQYSSFQIGKLLHVSRQAVNQWIDKGYIQSHRTPGGHRRVLRADLMEFLRLRHIPIPSGLEQGVDPATIPPSIMLVDDDDYLLLLARAIHDAFPHAALRSYRNGLDALVAIGQQVPDLLILDLQMPMIDGVEVCRRLKLNEHTRSLPIMVVTAFDTDEKRNLLAALGVHQVLGKSQSLDDIVRAVADFFPALHPEDCEDAPLEDMQPTA